jgi:hypothetical protein
MLYERNKRSEYVDIITFLSLFVLEPRCSQQLE